MCACTFIILHLISSALASYFHSAFRSAFLRSGFHSCPRLLHQCVTGGLDCIILNCKAQLCYHNDDISSNSQQICEIRECSAINSWYTFFKNRVHKLPVCIQLSVYRHNVSACSQPLSFPAVFADFQAAFLKQHVSILHNMIVYGNIKVYHIAM